MWEISLERAGRAEPSPAGQVSWTGRRGAVDYGVSAMFENTHLPIDGEEARFDAAHALEQRYLERIAEDEREHRLSAELKTPYAGGVLGLNLALTSEHGRERHDVSSFTATGADDGAEQVAAREREEIGEISASYARNWRAWETEIAALIARRRLAEEEASEEFEAGGLFDESERETREVESGETILRGSVQRELGEDGHFAFGGEAAFNTLDQRLELSEDDGSGPVLVDLPGADVEIEEWRAEAYAALAWRAAAWRLEASAAVETSRLTQNGDTSNRTQLTYWKPSLRGSRQIGEDDQLRLRIYRDVGQLDFEDFAASAELSGGDVFAGNTNLRPETSWRFEAAGDWRFEQGALELVLFYWRIEDALDFIAVGTPPDLFDARGNIGEAQLWGVQTSFELPVPGLDGARLRVEGAWRESEARDPLTGDTRAQSGVQESFVAVEFRHDVRSLDFAWGVEFEREGTTPEFRLDRVVNETDADQLEIWIETTRLEGLKLRLFAANLARPRDLRDRSNFDPDRNGAFDGSEQRRRELGAIVGIEVQGGL